MAVLYLIAISYVLARRVRGIGAWRIINSTARITAASALAAAAAWFTAQVAGGHFNTGSTLSVKLAAGVQLIPGLAVGAVVYVVMCVALKVEEAQLFFGKLRSRVRRRSNAAA